MSHDPSCLYMLGYLEGVFGWILSCFAAFSLKPTACVLPLIWGSLFCRSFNRLILSPAVMIILELELPVNTSTLPVNQSRFAGRFRVPLAQRNPQKERGRGCSAASGSASGGTAAELHLGLKSEWDWD